jgi:hypothetical protein
VQELEALAPRLAGLQATVETTAAAKRLTVVVAEPFNVTVMVTFWSVENDIPATAVKEPEVAPLAIATPAGTVKFALLAATDTTFEPDAA